MTVIYRRYGKRPFDVLFSATALALASPLMAAVAVAIRLDDGGPVFYRQQRLGIRGEPFTLLKFRSMDANTSDIPKAAAGAVMVTRVGRIIRRLNIDELPQLVNILRGQMSVVGPRPALPAQQSLHDRRVEIGATECLPGLTGLAQVSAYDGMPEEEKALLDGKYCANISFRFDLHILLRTFSYLRRPPPVY